MLSRTSLMMWDSSLMERWNSEDSSHSRQGYDNHRSRISSASAPVATVPFGHMYLQCKDLCVHIHMEIYSSRSSYIENQHKQVISMIKWMASYAPSWDLEVREQLINPILRKPEKLPAFIIREVFQRKFTGKLETVILLSCHHASIHVGIIII